jgi:UDP-N-acetylmuramate--alanine ligase
MALPNTHYGANRIEEMLTDAKEIFFIGIGGVSMCSLALILLGDGMRVSGSDRTESVRTERLRDAGAEVFIGHSAGNLKHADAVVYTVAISEDNPEYTEAKRLGVPLISRSDFLGYLMMRFQTRIGISGMNGKSTTTAMCAQILASCMDATVLCGADMPSLGGGTCRIGKRRDALVFEACEYMDSFLDFNPTVAVILNVGMDHVDYFRSLDQIYHSFRRYAESVGENGCVVCNADDAPLMSILKDSKVRKITFGIQNNADFTAKNLQNYKGKRCFDFYGHGQKICRISLCQPGEFQVENALAAATAAYVSGADPLMIERGFSEFCGIRRRMEYKGTLNGAAVYDDYAHHPSAIDVSLRAARELGYKRVLCAYQPHTYSRTAGLFDEFTKAFDMADRVFFTDIYAAREQNESGVSCDQLAEQIGSRAISCGDLRGLADAILHEVRDGDLLLIMGAGDIECVFSLLPISEN